MSTEITQIDSPQFRPDAKGNMIHLDNIKEIDIARDEIVIELMEEAKELGAKVAAFKKKALDSIQAFAELSHEKYGKIRGGVKGNITLTSFNGEFQLMRRNADRITFSEQLQAAQALIQECFEEWTESACSELRTIVNSAFKTDKNGNLSVGKILGLRAHKIDHPKWLMAMEAISDSITITGTKSYVCFYQRNSIGQYIQISLDPTEL